MTTSCQGMSKKCHTPSPYGSHQKCLMLTNFKNVNISILFKWNTLYMFLYSWMKNENTYRNVQHPVCRKLKLANRALFSTRRYGF